MEDIDREVAEKVMGWNPNEDGDWDTPDGHWCGYYEHEWHPSTSISDAWQVVETIDDCLHLKEHGAKGIWCAMFCGLMQEWEHGDTAPLAICKAALKAVG